MTQTTNTSGHLTRSLLWSSQLKPVLEDELFAMGYVNWLSEFPDGDQFNIPSIGEATVRDYVEDTEIVYDALDTGNFPFTISEYLSSATYITKKNMQDMFYMSQLVSSFVPKQARAIAEHVETEILNLQSGQTFSDLNVINNANHRFVGNGTNDVIAVADFARALYALKKANVPQTQMIAIVDPSVEFELNTQTNLTNVSNNPMWQGIIADGIATGMRFTKNVYGFDVYVSNYLADAGASGDGSETINSNSVTNGKCNLFFSAAPDVKPFVGAWRQMPEVDSQYVQNRQRDEYVTTARYGKKLYRPENLVTVITDSSQVS
jgi:hypothetical protein